MDSDGDDEGEEGIETKGVKNVYLPAQLEIEEHQLAHLPVRHWCTHCVQGKGVSAAHKKRRIEESQVLVISTDYMGFTNREP